MDFATGLYESVVTAKLRRWLRASDGQAVTEGVEDAESAGVLAEHGRQVVADALAAAKPEDRVALAKRLLAGLAGDDPVEPGPQQLLAVRRPVAPGVWSISTRPSIPLAQPALLTNSRGEPTLAAELGAEIDSSNSVDLLCAFVKWYGLRLLEQPLVRLRERGGRLRVLTTTYVGATERVALDRLVREYGAEVRINYETRSTRLHVKAWLFSRATGFDTAYVGSSNLSRAALLDGLEWNVRLAGAHTPAVVDKFRASFDSYWADRTFEFYNPDRDADRLDDALRRAGGAGVSGGAVSLVSGLEVRPFRHQAEMLERLDVERRVHDRHRNLIVAATGTGKTVVAALDYRRLVEAGDRSLLFVAHRKEILEQSLRTYRDVLADGSFGELYVGGQRPERWRHVFASVQSLSAYGVERIAPDHFDVFVLDESHHMEAASYRRLMHHVAPSELLALTATPERADGIDIAREFFDGRVAADLRLWDALAEDLLCPFHYFGLNDETDLSRLDWRRGDYDTSSLEQVYTASDARVRIVLRQLRDKVGDTGGMRALGFCVSKAHARFMADRFRTAGIPALAVTDEDEPVARRDALLALKQRQVNVLFAVDLFNEGLDVPEVDTLLLLRPTASATVFLQQLGRGLRRTRGKPVLTVLDFVGEQRAEFRFETRYAAMTGFGRRELVEATSKGFPFLPSGCSIVLDRVTQQRVLDHVRAQLNLTRQQRAAEVARYGTTDLSAYLGDSTSEPADIYRSGGSWTALLRAAGLLIEVPGPQEDDLLKRTHAFLHVDDADRAAVYTLLAGADAPTYDQLGGRQKRLARMLLFTLWPDRGGFTSYEEGLRLLRAHPAVCEELRQVVALGLSSAQHVPLGLELGLQQVTLATHARHRREEILAALDWASMQRSARGNITGVAWAEETATDALLVNLTKSERDFSPSTMYRDYALSDELFHWESQNATSAASAAGQRYIQHRRQGSHVLLFVRDAPTDDVGTAPFICLGPAEYVSHTGDRPMAVTWKLTHRLPPQVLAAARAVAS